MTPAAGLAREEVERGLGAHCGLMMAGVGVGRHRRGMHDGAEARRLRQLKFRCRVRTRASEDRWLVAPGCDE
jgi:hypothetical protein